jgi:hypothetical protein
MDIFARYEVSKSVFQTSSLYSLNHSLVDLYEMPDSDMYRADVVNVDKQDDGAARRFYHLKSLRACTEVVDGVCRVKDNFKGIFVYQFILGKPT